MTQFTTGIPIQSLKPYQHEGERANDYDKLLLRNVGMEVKKIVRK
jgi:hypothetical protein